MFTIASGIIYFNNVYLPIKVKSKIINALETNLNYNARIQKIKYNLFRGIVIRDVTIYDKTGDKENTLLTIKEASFNLLFIPLIKEKKIIIPIIHIDSPYLYIRYKKDNNFNFSKIFSPKPNQPLKSKMKFSFLIYKVNIFNANIVFEDEHLTPRFRKTIQDFNIGLTISPLAKVLFLLQGKLLTDKEAITKLSLEGEYNFLSKELNSKLNFANLIIPEFKPYLKVLPVSIVRGIIENSNLELKFKDNLINLKGSLYVKGLELMKEKMALNGNINIEPDISYAIDKKIFDYKANFKIVQANLDGIKYIEKINNISGDISLIKDKLVTASLKLQTLDSEVRLRGTLENFLNPYLKLNLISEQLNLEKLLSILPLKPKGINLSGLSKSGINIEGYLKKPPLDIKASFELKDAKFQTVFLKEPINNIKGRLDLTLEGADWLNLSFDYRNITYTSTGKLVNFKAPQINFGLTSGNLDLKSDIKVKDNIIKINTFLAKYADSELDIKGDIDTRDNATILLDLSTKLNLKTQDALIFLPQDLAERLRKIKLEGILNIVGSINGNVKNYKELNIYLETVSDAISVYNLKFSNLSFNLRQRDGTLNISRFAASGYSGIVNLDFSSDLKPDVPTYALKFNCSGIDLGKMKLDTDFKDKDIAGISSVSADLYGNFKDSGLLKGRGSASIKNGNLWKFNLFKGMGELFFLPDYEKVIFKEATAEFNIENRFISTENLKLISDQLNLDCKGKVGFDGGLDFTVYTEANKNLIRDSADIRKFTTAILGELSNAITVRITGTIQKPKYSIAPMAVDLIKNIKNFILGK